MEPFQFEAGTVIWTILTFVCLFALLARFVFKPLRELMEKREQSIRGSLDQAERAREEARKILEKNREQLDGARDEARRIVNEGHRIVANMKQDAEAGAKQQAQAIVEQARSEIDRDVQRSLDELKSTVANLSVRISRQVIRDNIDEAQHQKLADELVERLKRSHASRRS